MAAAVGPRTVLVVGSAPQYPQGVVDPIPAIAELAASVGANCHVDACMGGFVLPFAERLGRDVAPWDFRVDGVHSISADVHKLGYAPKGVSVILHRTKELRRYQTFVFDGWLGGLYASPNLQGTRSGAPMAAAWAVMRHLGVDGYVELTRRTLDAADRLRAGIAAIDGVRVLGDGDVPLRGDGRRRVPASTCSPSATRCAPRGWHLDRQSAAGLAARDRQPGQRGDDGRLPRRPRGGRGRPGPHRRPQHQLRDARVAGVSAARPPTDESAAGVHV